MSKQEGDDLIPEVESGYIPSAKKTVDEYAKLDAEDESLQKWKKSLGLLGGEPLPVDPNDDRRVVILEMSLLIDGESPIVVDLTKNDILENLTKNYFKIKEKSIYKLKIKFKVQHEIVTGIKYLQAIKKAGIRVDKVEDPLGSYAPNTKDKPFYEVILPETEAPSGLLARGSYSAQSKFIDDDKVTHLSLNWGVDIVKK
ncbi:Rho GDP-dissociation inhibitor 1 [Wickerhamomyces ciferrii]|uniref:Rho GDP-dissociation inhibitor n=1 Tax=Wickerhamomyces ciferrii (strain ATCC 14091 / BCRC 22168 / CBS 111 / JCM 3599 / NBRC 0793 / NRRL Y-1031 F-60-10) TaxID=1206466 RepID=K0KGX6_WICCF|nr:Rho GDP-dissociation inhibitor 1 [Wickerhamomyces ciferrii]CCH41437.1 Rho GDP-dissociation inhibitor 1 [Wickerhamomyces ciferrii]